MNKTPIKALQKTDSNGGIRGSMANVRAAKLHLLAQTLASRGNDIPKAPTLDQDEPQKLYTLGTLIIMGRLMHVLRRPAEYGYLTFWGRRTSNLRHLQPNARGLTWWDGH